MEGDYRTPQIVATDELWKRDPLVGSLMIGLAYSTMEMVFRHVSGGPFNPAIAIAQIIWQVMTYGKQPGFTWSHWTGDYVAIYMIAPMLGALMAGNFYSFIHREES